MSDFALRRPFPSLEAVSPREQRNYGSDGCVSTENANYFEYLAVDKAVNCV